MTAQDLTAFERLGALVIILEPDGAIVHWNRACAELTGRELDEVRGRQLWELLPTPEQATRAKDALGELGDGMPSICLETTWALATGELRTVALTSSVVRGPDARVEQLIFTGVDITDLLVDRDVGPAPPPLGLAPAKDRPAIDESARRATDAEARRRWQAGLSPIIAVATDAIISLDGDQRVVIYNQGAMAIFGWSPDEVLGQPLDRLIPERFLARHRQHVERFAAAPPQSRRVGARHGPIIGLRKSGEEFAAEASISSVDVAGERLLTVMLRDISEPTRIAEALRLSEARLALASSASPVVLFSQDAQLRYTWIHNPKAFTAEQVLGKTDFDLLPTADAEHLASLKREVLATGVGTRAIVRTTLQSERFYYDLTLHPVRDRAGRVVGINGATWEVTDQRRLEDEQRLLAEFGAALMVAAPDPETTLAELTRLAVRELADWFLIDVVDADQVRRLKVGCADPARAALAVALERIPLDRDQPHLMFEPLMTRRPTLVPEVAPGFLEAVAQGPEHLELLRALDVRSFLAVPLLARGRLLGAFAMISGAAHRYGPRDLRFAAELARLAAFAVDNAQLYRASRRASTARDEVLGVVAHDLRSPLNMVLMQAERLERRGDEVERRSQTPVDAIRRAAVRMDRLIQDMLDVAGLEAGPLAVERAAVASRSLLDEALETQRAPATNADLQLRLDVVARLPDVLVDRDRLLQVFDNLIGNAIKFTPRGGEIVIGATPAGGEVRFWVRDTGCGIPPDDLAHLFDRFWQARKADRRGLGLGLAIVKGIIDAHGGRVWAESQLGAGTTFCFTVPVAAAAAAHPSPPASP